MTNSADAGDDPESGEETVPVTALSHIALAIDQSHLDVVVDFYQQVFGWSKVRELHLSRGPVKILTDGHGFEIEFMSRSISAATTDPPGRLGFISPGHLGFIVDERRFDQLMSRLHDIGLIVEPLLIPAKPKRTGQGVDARQSRAVFFDDPAGNRIEIAAPNTSAA